MGLGNGNILGDYLEKNQNWVYGSVLKVLAM